MVIVNLLLMITLVIFILVEIFCSEINFADKKGNCYILLCHCIFSFFSSLTLFSFGFHLKQMISDSLTDAFANDFDCYMTEPSMYY